MIIVTGKRKKETGIETIKESQKERDLRKIGKIERFMIFTVNICCHCINPIIIMRLV